MKKILKYFEGVATIFVAIGIQVAVLAIISLVYIMMVMGIQFVMALNGKENADFVTPMFEVLQSQEIIYIVSIISILVCGIVFFFWYKKITRGEARGNYRNLVTKKNIILFLLLGLGCQFFLAGFMTLIQPFFEKIFSDYAKTVENIFSGNIIVVVLFVVVVAPITEELIFRGVMLKKLSLVIPFVGANILQAVIFGIYHWNIVQGTYAFGMGLLLGYIAHRFKTIIAPIALHMMINASAFLMLLVPNNLIAYIVLLLVGAALLIMCLFKIRAVEVPVTVIQDVDIFTN